MKIRQKFLFFLILFCSAFAYAQLPCPSLTSPLNNDTNVPVDTQITWNAIVGAPAYLISIGTSAGGVDILNNQNVGNATSYLPPQGLPEQTDIYVTITIFFFNSENITCSTEMFRTENVTEPPNCTQIKLPVDEAINVNIATSISWDYAPTATGYRLSLGTSLGGFDILDNQEIIGSLSYRPPIDLPTNTEIFVRVVPFNENGPAPLLCTSTSFTTGALATIPTCASLISPLNGAINVELSPVLQWTEVSDAIGYRVTIGTTPFSANILDNVTFSENRTLVVEFKPNLTFFITISPFNAAGEALNCEQQSFSTILGCGPYFDAISNKLVDLRPEINFPDIVSFCDNDNETIVTTQDRADGYRWYKIDQFDNEQVISSKRDVSINESGLYRYEAFNVISQSGTTIECSNSKIFEVQSSELATIEELKVTGQNGTITVDVEVSGIGDYEFAVDTIDGPYQKSSIFQNLNFGSYTFYVRDKNGCGIAEERLEQDLSVEGFPKFFTPNGDGINDFWQFIQPLGKAPEVLGIISIFNRQGMLLKQISPTSYGWDGNFNGSPLPSADYWFKVTLSNRSKLTGHFALKR